MWSEVVQRNKRWQLSLKGHWCSGFYGLLCGSVFGRVPFSLPNLSVVFPGFLCLIGPNVKPLSSFRGLPSAEVLFKLTMVLRLQSRREDISLRRQCLWMCKARNQNFFKMVKNKRKQGNTWGCMSVCIYNIYSVTQNFPSINTTMNIVNGLTHVHNPIGGRLEC